MKKYHAIPVLFILLIGLVELNAQQAHVKLDWAPQEIRDGFRPFMAPDVQEVLLSGNIILGLKEKKPVPFSRGEDGLWTLTVGPLTPEIYYYKLMIEGLVVLPVFTKSSDQ
jgi:enterochelin esterase family protein